MDIQFKPSVAPVKYDHQDLKSYTDLDSAIKNVYETVNRLKKREIHLSDVKSFPHDFINISKSIDEYKLEIYSNNLQGNEKYKDIIKSAHNCTEYVIKMLGAYKSAGVEHSSVIAKDIMDTKCSCFFTHIDLFNNYFPLRLFQTQQPQPIIPLKAPPVYPWTQWKKGNEDQAIAVISKITGNKAEATEIIGTIQKNPQEWGKFKINLLARAKEEVAVKEHKLLALKASYDSLPKSTSFGCQGNRIAPERDESDRQQYKLKSEIEDLNHIIKVTLPHDLDSDSLWLD